MITKRIKIDRQTENKQKENQEKIKDTENTEDKYR